MCTRLHKKLWMHMCYGLKNLEEYFLLCFPPPPFIALHFYTHGDQCTVRKQYTGLPQKSDMYSVPLHVITGSNFKIALPIEGRDRIN